MINMNELTVILLVPFFAVAESFPVTPSAGGNLFYCSVHGCAANVTHAYCNDHLVSGRMINCTGPPPPNTICQHDGRAFVSFDAPGSCDFEGKEGYISTQKCTDRRNICALNIAVTSIPKSTEKDHATLYIVIGVLCSLLVVGLAVGIPLYFCKIRKPSQHHLSCDPGEAVPMRERPGESSGRHTDDGPGSDDGSSPCQPNQGA